MDDRVSLMIPCYNGEQFLDRLLKCLCDLDYKNCHIIFADDGSTDSSAIIINSYRDKLRATGKELTYLHQENGGLASAINLALSRADGDYLAWMDVDDRIDSLYLKKMIGFLKSNPKHQWAMCKGKMYLENDLDTSVGTLGEEVGSDNYSEDLLLERVDCSPGLYVVRLNAMLDVLSTNRHIYDRNRRMGQNMQLLVPMAMKYGRPGRVEEYLFFYTIREMSMSHSVCGDSNKEIEYIEHIQDIKTHTINECRFIKEEYKRFLCVKLEAYKNLRKAQRLMECNDDETIDSFKKIVDDLGLQKKAKGRQIAVWGYCKFGTWWAERLNRILGDADVCYIESDLSKCDGQRVLFRDNIDPNKYYLVIPIGIHQSILDTLRKKEYTQNDYFYFEEVQHQQYQGEVYINA